MLKLSNMNGNTDKLKKKIEKAKMINEIQNLKTTANGTVKKAATDIISTWFEG